jgi:protein involved in sex pheromone biosynthesis
MKEGGFGYYTKDELDAQGNKISGTVILRLQLNDNTYRDIPTIVEDGVIKSIANTPTIQVAQ